MLSGDGNFEVQVMKDGRWVTEAARNREAEALQLAEKFLANKSCAGARVIANMTRRDGSISEKTIFEKTQDTKEAKATRITPLDVAPILCKSPRDFFSLESRMVMNRLLRSYLESVFLTPTELLHSHRDLQRLEDIGSLLPSAVSHIAKLQAEKHELILKDRQTELFEIVDQIVKRAGRAEVLDLPKLSKVFSDTLDAVSGRRDETAEYLAMVVLSRELLGVQNWIGKLDMLCNMAARETDHKAVLLLDTVIADVLGANVIQELLGWRNSLGSAIIGMLDLADGNFDPSESNATETATVLIELFQAGHLPAARNAIIDRAMRQLKSPQPLSRNDPGREMEEYQNILLRLLRPGGLISGAQAAEALTVRGTRFVEQGGATGQKAAINATVRALPDRARGVMYLAELSTTDFADGHIDHIVKELDNVFGARVIGELCRRSLSPKDRMVAATGAYNTTLSSALPDEMKERLTEHIDGVLERYLVDEDIINKLDKPEDHIRDRAVRLVKFCGAGVLPEGRALTLARKRIVQLLRQPRFDELFIEGIHDPAKAEKALRDFHKLLMKAGIA